MKNHASIFAMFTLLVSLLAFSGQALAEQTEQRAEIAAAININTASAIELAQLDGIGETKALAIVADRQANGPFASTEDLTRVRGIGEATVAKNADRITAN